MIAAVTSGPEDFQIGFTQNLNEYISFKKNLHQFVVNGIRWNREKNLMKRWKGRNNCTVECK